MTNSSKALDQYFTPPKLAQDLINAVTLENPVSVVDFAAGDGELLRAAMAKWPGITCSALDVDNDVVELLQQNNQDWIAHYCDFTNSESRNSVPFLGQDSAFPLIVLNPPFSSKGKALSEVEIGGISTRCSPALAFVIAAASYLQDAGQLVAIVPYGMVHNERDRVARDLLKVRHKFELVGTYAKGGFANCSPRTAIIRLTAVYSGVMHSNEQSSAEQEGERKDIRVSVIRGKVPNNLIKSSKGRIPFIHTTNLKKNTIAVIDRHVGGDYKHFNGPGILMPRVGRPAVNKVVLLNNGKSFVMSECLFLLECDSSSDALVLYNSLLSNWDYIIQKQGGTCANFLSIQTMIDCLRSFGFSVLDNGKSVRTVTHTEYIEHKTSLRGAHAQA